MPNFMKPYGISFRTANLPSMFSKIVAIVFAVGCISVGSGLGAELKSAYEVAFHCTKVAWDADISDLQAKEGSATVPDKIEEGCIFFRVRFNKCLAIHHT